MTPDFLTAPQVLLWLLSRDRELVFPRAGMSLREAEGWHREMRNSALASFVRPRILRMFGGDIAQSGLDLSVRAKIYEIVSAEIERGDLEFRRAGALSKIEAVGRLNAAGPRVAINSLEWPDVMLADAPSAIPACRVVALLIPPERRWGGQPPPEEQLSAMAASVAEGGAGGVIGWTDLLFPADQVVQAFPPLAGLIRSYEYGAPDLWELLLPGHGTLAEVGQLSALGSVLSREEFQSPPAHPAALPAGPPATRGRGRPQTTALRARDAMEADLHSGKLDRVGLADMKQEALAARYDVSRKVATNVRNQVLGIRNN